MLKTSELTSALQTYWQQHGPQTVPCQFPGVPLNANTLAAWLEFWITQIREEPRRPGGCDRLLILIDIHCFSRHKTDQRQINKLVDDSRQALKYQSILLTKPDLPDSNFGLIRFHEPVTRELTRLGPEHTLHHQVLSITATAEEF